MNKHLIFIALSFIIFNTTVFAQTTDTLYLDGKSKPSSKEASTYSRILIQEGEVYQVTDFYKTGEKQMTGTLISLSPEKRDGTFTWFYKNGNKSAEKVYKKGDLISGEWWDESGNPKKNELFKLEKQPQYVGGMAQAYAFIKNKFFYPRGLNPRPVGRIVISFVVDVEGEISDVEVVESVHPDLDREAVRVVKSMPKWEPGVMNGKPVRVKYRLPLSMN